MTILSGTRWRWLAFWGVIVVVAFGAGRVSIPAEVERVTDIQIRTVTKTVTQRQAARVVYVDRYVSPDGAVSERREERTQETSKVEAEAQTDQRTKTKEIVKTQPNWAVGVLAGATWKEPALRLGDTPLVLGATVDFRIPNTSVWAGVWGTTQGAGGLGVKLEF